MRIIAGDVGGRQLATPKGMDTRPTQDKVKESLFSILRNDLEGARVLDLFAGSGALGLEALSRGADFAVFADKARPAQECVQKNIQALRMEARTRLLRCHWKMALKKLEDEGERFDLIFLDPPYRMEGANEMLSALCAGKICGPETLVIYEHAKALPPDTAGWETLDRRDYRDTVITFLRKEAHGDADGVVSGIV